MRTNRLFPRKVRYSLLLILGISFLLIIVWLLWNVFNPLSVVVINKSNNEIVETKILYYYTASYDLDIGEQQIGEKEIYRFSKGIEANEKRKEYPKFDVGGEGGLGIQFTFQDGDEISASLCGYLESSPIGKFTITIDDNRDISINEFSLLGSMCW